MHTYTFSYLQDGMKCKTKGANKKARQNKNIIKQHKSNRNTVQYTYYTITYALSIGIGNCILPPSSSS